MAEFRRDERYFSHGASGIMMVAHGFQLSNTGSLRITWA